MTQTRPKFYQINFRKIHEISIRSKKAFRSYYKKIDAESLLTPCPPPSRGRVKSKVKITGGTHARGNTKDVKIILPLKYLSNFWGTLKMPLINCEVSYSLTWSSTCVITNSTGERRFTITDTKILFRL